MRRGPLLKNKSSFILASTLQVKVTIRNNKTRVQKANEKSWV